MCGICGVLKMGYAFFSDGDTEVLLKAYHVWGGDAVKRFNGVFAFAIRHRDSGRFVISRDRLGIKPLYYSIRPNRVSFASTLPALLVQDDVDRESGSSVRAASAAVAMRKKASIKIP
jgi:asparagine synthase (glutamine-hydrolysing)